MHFGVGVTRLRTCRKYVVIVLNYGMIKFETLMSHGQTEYATISEISPQKKQAWYDFEEHQFTFGQFNINFESFVDPVTNKTYSNDDISSLVNFRFEAVSKADKKPPPTPNMAKHHNYLF